jgi:hypothetical protein
MTNRFYDIEYYNNKHTSKISLKNAILKFLVYININYTSDIRIICAWDNNQVNFLLTNIKNYKFTFVFIDYSQKKREWYIHYNNPRKNIIYNGIIDDINGHIECTN